MEAALALALALSEPSAAPPPSERQHYCVREEIGLRLSRSWSRRAPSYRSTPDNRPQRLDDLPPARVQRAVYCQTRRIEVVPVERPRR